MFFGLQWFTMLPVGKWRLLAERDRHLARPQCARVVYFPCGQAESQRPHRFSVRVDWANSDRALPCTGDRQMKLMEGSVCARCKGPNAERKGANECDGDVSTIIGART